MARDEPKEVAAQPPIQKLETEKKKSPGTKYEPNRYPTPIRKQASPFIPQKRPQQIEDISLDDSIPDETINDTAKSIDLPQETMPR
jgi:hypothetical protein